MLTSVSQMAGPKIKQIRIITEQPGDEPCLTGSQSIADHTFCGLRTSVCQPRIIFLSVDYVAVKSHMKISGQFESEAAADNHALIRTYIETCRRNGINEIDALKLLCDGNPYTVGEVFHS